MSDAPVRLPAAWRSLSIIVSAAIVSTLMAAVCGIRAKPFEQLTSRGVLVAGVATRSAAQRAGIRDGDSILAWLQGSASGAIESPFDLNEAELEYAARGEVVLLGNRGAQQQRWVVPAGRWGITARPPLADAILREHDEARKLAAAAKTAEALAKWRMLAAEISSSEPSWSAVWLLSEAASELAAKRRWPEADELMQAALDLPAAEGPMIRAQLLESWAQTFYTRDWKQAGLRFLESLEQRRRLGPESLCVAYVTNSLGFVARNQGLFSQAEDYYRQAFSIGERLAPQSLAVATFLNNLAFVAQYRGALIRAEDYYLRALEIRRKVAPETSLRVLSNLGSIALEEGDLPKAERYWNDALSMAPSISPDSATILGNLRRLAELRGDLRAAATFETRSSEVTAQLAPDSLDYAGSLSILGRIAWRMADLDRAEENHRRALAIREKSEPGGLAVADSLRDLGLVAASRADLAAAEAYQMKALRLRETLARGTAAHADSLYRVASLRRSAGRLAEGAKLLGEAVEILEGQAARLDGGAEARLEFRTRFASYYRDYVETLLADNQPEKAFAAMERSRARSLLQMLAERDLVLSGDLPASLKQERKLNEIAYDRLQAQLLDLPPGESDARAALQARLNGYAAERERIAERIRRASPRIAALQYPEPLDLNGIRQSLDPGVVLLAYAVGAERAILFVVQPIGREPGLSTFSIPAGDIELRSLVAKYRDLIAAGAPTARAELAAKSRELYDLLVKPAEQRIAAASRLLILPDGALHVLPFAALLRPDGSPLIEQKPLHTAVSGTVYSELKKRERRRRAGVDLLAFGDPILPAEGKRPVPVRGRNFGRLLFSRDEVAGIAGLYPGRSRRFLGVEATEERVKALGPSARLLHFAVHAFLDANNPLDSALVLTPPANWAPGEDNGLLQAWEVFEHVRLDADLVVLSACDTGLGKEERGEGLIGLSRAFHYAGARSVLASLWRVDDRSTSQLMTRFYTELRGGKSKDEALRAAQLALKRRNPADPYYWAAFSLMGDWQ
jgi:CHAT domain-containing protein